MKETIKLVATYYFIFLVGVPMVCEFRNSVCFDDTYPFWKFWVFTTVLFLVVGVVKLIRKGNKMNNLKGKLR